MTNGYTPKNYYHYPHKNYYHYPQCSWCKNIQISNEQVKLLIDEGYVIERHIFTTTDKGKELIKALIITSNFLETQNSIKKDAEELLVKAKDKYNSLLDNLKI
jgi:uncharacterized protein YdaT